MVWETVVAKTAPINWTLGDGTKFNFFEVDGDPEGLKQMNSETEMMDKQHAGNVPCRPGTCSP